MCGSFNVQRGAVRACWVLCSGPVTAGLLHGIAPPSSTAHADEYRVQSVRDETRHHGRQPHIPRVRRNGQVALGVMDINMTICRKVGRKAAVAHPENITVWRPSSWPGTTGSGTRTVTTRKMLTSNFAARLGGVGTDAYSRYNRCHTGRHRRRRAPVRPDRQWLLSARPAGPACGGSVPLRLQ